MKRTPYRAGLQFLGCIAIVAGLGTSHALPFRPSNGKRQLPANHPIMLELVRADQAIREAEVYGAAGKRHLAEVHYRTALREEPWPMVAEAYGRFLEKQSRPKEALGQYLYAVEPGNGYSPNDSLDFLLHAAELADRIGDDRRDALYRRVIAVGNTPAPQFPHVVVAPGASIEQLRCAAKVIVGVELLIKGNHAATSCLAKAVEIDSSNPTAHFYLAYALWLDNKQEHATNSYWIARNNAGRNQELIASLAWIEKACFPCSPLALAPLEPSRTTKM